MTITFEFDAKGKPINAGDRFAAPVIDHNYPEVGDQTVSLVLDKKAKDSLELVRALSEFWYTGCMEYSDALAELREWKMFGMAAHKLLHSQEDELDAVTQESD